MHSEALDETWDAGTILEARHLVVVGERLKEQHWVRSVEPLRDTELITTTSSPFSTTVFSLTR